jgi:hypothetical protein
LGAFDRKVSAGRRQITPRNALSLLDYQWRLRRVDVPVWPISCFHVRKGYKRCGVTAALIATGVRLGKVVSGASGEAERSFRRKAERHSGMIPNTIGA